MTNKRFGGMSVGLAVVIALFLGGCGGGDSNDMTGIWNVRWSATEASMTLTQDENGDITGAVGWIVGDGPPPTLVSGHMGGDTAVIVLRLENNVISTITARLDGDALTGTVSIKYPWEATPAVFDLLGTRTPAQPSQPATGTYVTFTGTENEKAHCCAPGPKGDICGDGSQALNVTMVLGPDGKIIFPTGAGFSGEQNGSSFTMTYTDASVGMSVTWQGTINGDTVTGTVRGGANMPPARCNIEGTFNLTKSGESLTRPAIPSFPVPIP